MLPCARRVLFLTFVCAFGATGFSQPTTSGLPWTDKFDFTRCRFSSTGANAYFVLQAGYQLVLESRARNTHTKLIITVLDETIKIGDIEARVVEERESTNDRLVEVSRNYFALCDNSVYYFGEDVATYAGDTLAGHEGSWRAGNNSAKAGLMMPGRVLPGARFYQEIAPSVAMDRCEIVSLHDTLATPEGTFVDCVRMEETTPLEPGVREYKVYAPGVGLIRDGALLLTHHGFRK